MFKNTYQKGFLTIFYSIGSKPLAIWRQQIRNGHLKRIIDDDIKSTALEILGANVSTMYIAAPRDPKMSLGIKLPFLVLLLKNMRKLFTFEVQILDDQKFLRRFRISNYESQTRVTAFSMSMPMGLSPGWNQIHLNLADFTRRAYGTNYMETVRIQIHANIRIRRIYFTDQLYSEENLPNEYKIMIPKQKTKQDAKNLPPPQARPPSPEKACPAPLFGEKDLASTSEYDSENLDTSTAQPVFDFGMPRNISARTGQAALIKCHVDNLGDKSISWIRKRDLHILTVGTSTYTSDERFQVTQTDDSKEWTLQVKYPQPRDSGIYECQVNTEPKISMAFQLSVVVTPPHAKAVIVGPADLHFKVGSSIILTCVVKQPLKSTKLIGQIHWYRGEDVITPFHLHPNEVSADLSKRISMESQLGDTLKSRLRISNAQTLDTGNYTCSPTTASSASVMVHVINDEKPAAMQKSQANRLLQRQRLWCVANIVNLIKLIIYLMLPYTCTF